MAVLLTPAPPHGFVGPGLPLEISTTTVIPTGTVAEITFTAPTVPNVAAYKQIFPWNFLTPQVNTVTLTRSSLISVNSTVPPQLRTDDSAQGVVTLIQNNSILIDQGTITAPWNNSEGLPQLMADLTSGISGGLTDQQAIALNEIHTATFPSISLDTITLQEITRGPQGGTVGAQLANAIFGVIIRIATIPPEIVLNTPDDDYAVPGLAVVQLFRGSDIWKRIPIHRTSQIVSFLEENVAGGLPVLLTTQWLLQMSVQVHFRQNVTGQVFLMNFP